MRILVEFRNENGDLMCGWAKSEMKYNGHEAYFVEVNGSLYLVYWNGHQMQGIKYR